jgi:cell division septal protein FtsQ
LALPALHGSTRGAYVRQRNLRQASEFRIDRGRLVSLVVLMTLVLTGVWIGFADTFYISVPGVTGQTRVPVDDIARASGLIGLHVAWANSAEVESRLLEALPSLRTARVTCSLPADCAITVTEREPFLAWRWGDAVVWVDQDGVVHSARNGVQDVLTLESSDVQPPPPGQRVDPDLMAAIVAAAQALPEVRILRVSAARGLEFTDASGYPVYLGTGTNMADRVVVWRALRDDLASRGIEPLYIDVRFPLAPYYGRP